jgi:glutamate 5-kinase
VSESGRPGRFRDNDGLAALLAVQLKADLLMLCTDVNGVYTGSPSDPGSELLPTYSPDVSSSWTHRNLALGGGVVDGNRMRHSIESELPRPHISLL